MIVNVKVKQLKNKFMEAKIDQKDEGNLDMLSEEYMKV